MNRDETLRVNINYCVRDEELAEAEALCEKADPGEWRVSKSGQLTRYSGEPIVSLESIQFMARARNVLPRFLKGIRTLEEALRTAWAYETGYKAQIKRDRIATEEALERAYKGEHGPEGQVEELVEARKLGLVTDVTLAIYLRRWALGESVVEPWFRNLMQSNRLAAVKPVVGVANASCNDRPEQ